MRFERAGAGCRTVRLDKSALRMEGGLGFNGMQDRLDAQVLTSTEGHRKREKALEKIEELSRKDAWAVAMKIRLIAYQQVKLRRHS